MHLGASVAAGAEFRSQAGDRIFFGESSAELGARAHSALDQQATWLLQHPSIAVTVEGHADDIGSARHNLEVSRRRAEAVRQRLIERGVASERIGILAFGKTRRIAECNEPMCAAQNRRTITVLEPAASGSGRGAARGRIGSEPGHLF
jgi:peptidoglycan-associated lipoprotein